MGIFGIYGEKWKRFASYFKGFLAFEQRVEGRRAYYLMHKQKKLLQQIQTKVSEHKVSAAMKDMFKWHHDIAEAVEDEVKLGMGQIFQYFHILEITNHFVQALEKFLSNPNRPRDGTYKARVDALAQEMLQRMIVAIKQAEDWGNEDTKRLMAIMNKALEKKTGNFVTNFRLMYKQEGDLSLLGRIPLRMDIRRELLDEKYLDRLAKQLRSLNDQLNSLANKGKNARNDKVYHDILGQFEKIMFEGEHDIKEMFRSAHLIMKRDLMLMMMVLVDETVMRILGEKWVSVHFMPEEPIRQEGIKIEELEKKLSNKAHNLANGLNVIIKGEDSIKRKLEVLVKMPR